MHLGKKITYFRNLVERAAVKYEREGALGLFSSASSKTARGAVAVGPVDRICYRASIRELETRQASEETIDDVIDNVGYRVADHDAIRVDELERMKGPYAGIGTYPGKYHGYGLYSRIRMQQERNAIKELAETVAAEEPKTVLEIGSDEGGSFYVWSRCFDDAETLVSMDIEYDGRLDDLMQAFAPKTDVTCIEADSRSDEAFEAAREAIDGRRYDFVYIDADHAYESVKHDFERYSELLADGGVVGLHDITHPGTGVPRFWDELQETYETEELGTAPFKNGIVRP